MGAKVRKLHGESGMKLNLRIDETEMGQGDKQEV